MTNPTILVTGAAGFAGHHLVDRLLPATTVHGWRHPAGQTPPARDGVIWYGVDLTTRGAVFDAIAAIKPDRIFHLAGAANVATSWANAVPHLEVNALGTAHLLDAVRRNNRSCRIVVVTSAQIYATGDEPIREDAPITPQSPYGLTKVAQDLLALQAAQADGLDVMVARPFNHIGPRQAPEFAVSSFARQIARIEHGLEAPVLRVGNLETRRDVTDVRDVVDAYLRIMDGGTTGRAYNVCSGRAWRIRDLLDELLHLSTASITVDIDPAKFRPMDVPVVQGDATRLTTQLGWRPRIRVEDTLGDTLDWWRAEIASGRDATASLPSSTSVQR